MPDNVFADDDAGLVSSRHENVLRVSRILLDASLNELGRTQRQEQVPIGGFQETPRAVIVYAVFGIRWEGSVICHRGVL